MQNSKLSRRELMIAGSATLATLTLLNTRFASAAPLKQGQEVIPWLDQPEFFSGKFVYQKEELVEHGVIFYG